MSKGLVVKSNAVIEASYRLSVMEQRVILAAISQIRRDQVVSDDVMYELNVNTLRELSGTKSKAIYTDLKEAVNHLYERSIVIEKHPNGSESSTKKLKRSEEHTSELQSRPHLVCRLLLEKKKKKKKKKNNKKKKIKKITNKKNKKSYE